MIEIWLNGKKVSMLSLAAWGKEPTVGQTYTHLGQTYKVTAIARDLKTQFIKLTLGAA
ncbi:MAG: hypothetical protein ACK4TK_03430 [Thiobacillaceae bacterium]